MATIELSGSEKKIKQLQKELRLRIKRDNIVLKEVDEQSEEVEVSKPAKKKKADKTE